MALDGTPSPDASLPLQGLATWISRLDYSDLPPDAVSRIKQSVRDGFGCALYGSTLPWTQMVTAAMVAQSGAQGNATVFGSSTRLDVIGAALVNGTAVQAYELDDMHGEASLHGSSTMLPATIALAEMRGGVTGRELIVALATGWEAGLRFHRSIGNLLTLGWHPPTIMGTFAAAAAAGKLLGLSPEAMYHCLSLAALQASGLTAVQYGGMAKRLYAGRAAEIGVQCALFAERGVTAPLQALEHPVGGFYRTFGHDRTPRVEALTDGLGENFSASRIGFKLHACCGASQPALDLLADIVNEDPTIGAENIDSIDIALTDYGFKHVGFPYVPETATTAQFSVIYAFAAFLMEGRVFVEQFRDELLADEPLLRLASRISARPDSSLEGPNLMDRRAARVTVRTRDGRELVRQGSAARGHPDRPDVERELVDKFRMLASAVLDDRQIAELANRTQKLESVTDVGELVKLLAP